MVSQSYGTRDSMGVVDYPIFITRAVAAEGGRRWVRFHGPDGRERSVAVDIPPGVTTGTRVLVESDGTDWDTLSYGSLAVIVTVIPHHICECRGSDLYLTLWIDRATALREHQIEVPIGDGRVIAVPLQRDVWHGRFMYPGQGLLRGYAPRRRGDLIVRLEVLDLDEPVENAPAPAPSPPPNWWQALFGTRR